LLDSLLQEIKMSFLDKLFNRSVEKVLSQNNQNIEVGKKRKAISNDIDSQKNKKRKKENDTQNSEPTDMYSDSGCVINQQEGDSLREKKKKKKEKLALNSEPTYSEVTKKERDLEENEIVFVSCDDQSFNCSVKKEKGREDILKKYQRTPGSSKHETLITDIYCPPDPEIIQGELYNVVMYILNKNISISEANTYWTNNCNPSDKELKGNLEKLGVRLFNFTEQEDACIQSRIKLLVDTKVISNIKEFTTQLNNQNGNTHRNTKDKATRNIVGLYVGQDLPNRLAHTVTQRLIFLLTGTSIDNSYQHKLKQKRQQGVKLIKQQHREWKMEEDKILIRSVLKDQHKQGYKSIKDVHEKNVDWAVVAEPLTEYGRTQQLVRERWLRTVKVTLMEGDDLNLQQDRQVYRKELLQYILDLGVMDKKEIRWKEVATHFYPKTSSMLSQDFWAMIKRKKQPTLTENILSALRILENPQIMNGRSNKVVKKKEDWKASLIDFYQSLPKT